MSILNIIRKMKEKDREIRILILGLDNSGKTTVLKRFLGEDINTISPTVGFNIKTIQYKLPTRLHVDDGQPSSPSSSSLPLNNNNHNNDSTTASPTSIPNKQQQHQQKSLQTMSDHEYNLTIWDIGGQTTIRSCWSNYFTQTDGLIWVVDTTDVSRFQLCYEQLREVLKQEKLSGVSVLIFANKQDVPFACGIDEIRILLKLDELMPSHNTNDHHNQHQNQQTTTTTTKTTTTTTTPAHSSSSSNHHWFVKACSARGGMGIQEGFAMLLEDVIKRIYMG